MFSLIKYQHCVRHLVAQVPVALSSSKTSNMPKKCGKGGTAGGSGNKSSKSETSGGTTSAFSANTSPIVVSKDGHISISIQVKPGAKTDAITDISSAVGVQISAPPVDGEANIAIVKYFADLLKVKKADVSLKGGKSRQKTVMIASSSGLTAESVSTLLQSELQQKR